MNPSQIALLTEIRRLLKEAYDDYFRRGDGHCKSSEGYIEVRYPTYFEADKYERSTACSIGIYSYVLGPNRMHDFDDFMASMSTWPRRRTHGCRHFSR